MVERRPLIKSANVINYLVVRLPGCFSFGPLPCAEIRQPWFGWGCFGLYRAMLRRARFRTLSAAYIPRVLQTEPSLAARQLAARRFGDVDLDRVERRVVVAVPDTAIGREYVDWYHSRGRTACCCCCFGMPLCPCCCSDYSLAPHVVPHADFTAKFGPRAADNSHLTLWAYGTPCITDIMEVWVLNPGGTSNSSFMTCSSSDTDLGRSCSQRGAPGTPRSNHELGAELSHPCLADELGSSEQLRTQPRALTL